MTIIASDNGTVRDDAPVPNDLGLVVRLVGATGGVGTLQNGAITPIGPVAVAYLAANANRLSAIVRNVGAETIFLGVAGVTIATGMPLEPDGYIIYEAPTPLDELYAICAVAGSVFAQEITL